MMWITLIMLVMLKYYTNVVTRQWWPIANVATPALLNLNVPTMYVQEDEEWKWDGWWGWSSMWAFCPFYPLAPGKWGEMIPLFHPFSCPITRRKKNIRNRAEGRRGHLHHFQDWKKPNCNRGLGFWMDLLWYFYKFDPSLVKSSHGLSTNFAIFTKLYGLEISEKWGLCTISRQTPQACW